MYHICTTEKGAAQQHCFQKTLLSAMKQQNYEQITVTALCEQSGLSRKTFYRLFECKDDVLDALIDHTLQTYGVSQRSVTTIHDAFCRLFLYWQEQRTLLDALSRNNKTTLLIQRALIYTSSEAHDYTQYISFINTSCKQEILTFFLSGILSLIIYWHHTNYSRSVEEMADLAVQLLTHPSLRLKEN